VRIERLTTTHFRNLAAQALAFSPGVNLLVGENGQGKTNVLEAIYFFKFGRSFRAGRDAEVIRLGEPFCRAEVAAVFDDGARADLAASVERDGGKRVKIDGEELPRLSDLVGRFPAVLFGPLDLELSGGEPAERRRFVDMVGSMTDRAYIDAARAYRRILNQRNAALKARANDYEINIWNEQITVAGAELVTRRLAVVAALEGEVVVQAEALGAPYVFSMRYESALLRDRDALAGGPDGDAEKGAATLADVYAMELAARQDDERRRGTTLVGPHRDDVVLTLDGRDLRRYGSQGQRRLFAVLMKLAELSHLERELRERCVLLLDDVFSEFDDTVSARLQTLLDGTRQVFVTSPVAVEWASRGAARTYRVSQGELVGARGPGKPG
jgi:DNA replication and repair protein RecF